MSIDQHDHDALRTRLDAGIDHAPASGPALPTPGQRLEAGRRALRRRRAVAVSGATVAVLVVVGGGAVLGQGGSSPRGADPATPSTGAPTDAAGTEEIDEGELEEQLRTLAELAEQKREAREARQERRLVSKAFPAALDIDGSLVVKDGWEVTRRVPEPVGFTAPEKSLGVVVTDGTTTRWMLLTLQRAFPSGLSASASADDAGTAYSRYEDWLASMVELEDGGARTEPLVTVAPDDTVAPGPGAELVDLQEIDVIEGYTDPGDRVAELRRDGRTWFAVIRGHGAGAEVVPVDAAVLPESTLAALLTYVGRQAESGEGLR